MPLAPAIYYVVGPPAVGKLTIARALAGRLGRAAVVDNHLWSDPVFVPAGLLLGAPIAPMDPLRERIRLIVLEAMEIAPSDMSHVVTHYLTDDDESRAVIADVRELAARRGVDFVPVWLTASPEELLARVGNDDRRSKAKLVDPAVLASVLSTPPLPAPADALVLDTTALSPAQVVEAVLAARAPSPVD